MESPTPRSPAEPASFYAAPVGTPTPSPINSVRSQSSFDTIDIERLEVRRAEWMQNTSYIDDMLAFELRWLSRIVETTPADVRDKLVAHRGFHHVDDAVCRPLENSIAAFTQAWAHGLTYCECDIALLSDGHVVLNNDSCLSRLAADQRGTSRSSGGANGKSNNTNTQKHEDLGKMNLADVLRTPLRNGLNAPLLASVLNHAKALHGKLVLELKAGCASTTSLVQLFANDMTALDCVSIVTSVDLALIEGFVRQYREANLPEGRRPQVLLLTYEKHSDAVSEYELVLPCDAFGCARSICRDIVDGVYAEWTPDMLDGTREAFVQMCSEMVVGVWMRSGDVADNLSIAEQLVACGVSYVNTDLPYTFCHKD
eukprot:GEMP01015427.1.p1 GENE.GEMP01015427.1~~GEMP01015427.1.p1  ORF type:complete len:370 (+),score=77.13 GEMP01015427.1:119-1228(+)